MYRLLLRGVVGGLKLLPAPLAVGLGRWLGWVLQHVVRFRRRVVATQLRVALGRERTPAELAAVTTGFYRHLGLLFIELLRLPGTSPAQALARVDNKGRDYLEAALARGKGVLLLAGHLGNWELAGISLAALGYPVRAIGKEMRHPAGDVLRQMLRDDNGVPTIPRRDSLKLILRELKANHVVVVLIDQNMTAEEGVFVDFFGQPACTMKALAVLAARTGAAVLPGGIWRDPDGRHHHLEADPAVIPAPATGDIAADIRQWTQQYSLALEAMVRRHPEQWLWIHQRWRTRPPAEVDDPFAYRPRRRRRR